MTAPHGRQVAVNPDGTVTVARRSVLPNGAGVALDVDGTVTDTEAVWTRAERRTVEAWGGTWSAELKAAFHGVPPATTARRIAEACHKPASAALAVHEDLQRNFEAELAAGGAVPCPGAAELLDALAALGVPVAAVSNTSRRLVELMLTSAGLHSSFATVVCDGDQHNLQPKPAPDLYLEAARRMDIDPARSWGAEDSGPGAQALQAAGFLTLVTTDAAIPPTGAVLTARALWPLDVDDLFAMAASRHRPQH